MQAVDGVIFHPLFISVLNLMDTLLRTSLLTLSAAYTFRMIWIFRRVYLHLADFRTGVAAHTFFSVYPVAEHRNRVKHGVNSSKRAYVFAEWPINQNRQENCKKKQHVFPGIQPSQGAVHGFIQQNQRNAALQRPNGTNQFAKVRRSLPQNIYKKHRKQDYKKQQHYIFELAQKPVSFKCAKLSGKRYFV